MVKEVTLFGEENLEDRAIEYLKMFEPPEGYYVTFSGGKDSIVVKDLVKKSGVKYEIHYNLTTVDPPELVKYIKQQHPDVNINSPEESMWRLIPRKLMPPTRMVRYCCEVLKERGGSGRRVVTGVRAEESYKRSKRRFVENCFKDGTKTYINPILDWKDHHIWQYIKENNLDYCHLYDEGFKRLGCVMCPMANKKQILLEAKRWPKFYQAYVRAFDRMIEERKRRGKETEWETGEQVMYWWVYQPKKGNPDQTVLFE